MNEFLRTFVRKTILGMIGEVAEYEVRRYALGWFDKGVLLDTDLADIELDPGRRNRRDRNARTGITGSYGGLIWKQSSENMNTGYRQWSKV